LIGPASESAMNIDLTIALRNRTERHRGLTVNLLPGKSRKNMAKQLEDLGNYRNR
ncbi:unnamed protein product, partial [Rotaria magnacalcarata]